MKYVGSTIGYVFAHFFSLMLLAALPAVGISVLLEPNGFGLLAPWTLTENVKFADLFFSVFSKRAVTVYPYLFPVVLLVLTACVSYTLGVVDKHFRVGKFSLRSPIAAINDCFLPTGIMILLLALVYLLAKIVLVCVLAILTSILEKIGLPIVAIEVILTLVDIAAVVWVIIAVIPLMYTSTIMLVYGYSFKEAFGVALKLGSKEKRKAIDLGVTTAYLLYTIATAIISVTNLTPAIAIPVNVILTAFLLQYSCVFVMVSFFDLSGIERRDLSARRYGE